MSKTPEEKKDSELQINKGVELMLRNKKKVGRVIPKTFQVTFGKMIALWNREIHIFFDFSVLIRKQILDEEKDHE
jgi:hypothetical protein